MAEECYFHNNDLSNLIVAALFAQKEISIFCDVQIKVCGVDIFAHSSILAAASPYFNSFLAQDTPRQYSQRSPQVIEIQIDGTDPNVKYAEAVALIVDYIYTGKLNISRENVCQVSEIAKIMQLDQIVEFCEGFEAGRISNLQIGGSSTTSSSFLPISKSGLQYSSLRTGKDMRLKPGKLVSVSTQVNPTVLGLTPDYADKHTETEAKVFKDLEREENLIKHQSAKLRARSKGRLDKPKSSDFTEPAEDSHSIEVIKEDAMENAIEEAKEDKPSVAYLHCVGVDGEEKIEEISVEQVEDVKDICVNPNEAEKTTIVEIVPVAPGADPHILVSSEIDEQMISEVENAQNVPLRHSPRKRKIPAKFGKKGLYETDIEEKSTEDRVDVQSIKEEPSSQSKPNVFHLRSNSKRPLKLRPVGRNGKLVCDICDFKTNKVRQMASHRRLHKLEQNICYYCDHHFETRDEVTEHLKKHQGPLPYFCPVCEVRFKNGTQLSIHMPKHSDSKPFVCTVCSAGFKWKHALRSHMVVHSNKKDHLCDTCGYATAHKSQLKAHRRIHTGKTLKCTYPGCTFQATKKQNLKYHLLTHTREKPHQCEICGQSFTLVKNMRRHMLLHNTEKQHQCNLCGFSTTRLDKLREHLLRQHSIGTPPEKRTRVADLVNQGLELHGVTAESKMEGVTTEDTLTQQTIFVDASAIKQETQDTQQIQIITPSTDDLMQGATILVAQSLSGETFTDGEMAKNVLQLTEAPTEGSSEANLEGMQYETVMIPISQMGNIVQQVQYITK